MASRPLSQFSEQKTFTQVFQHYYLLTCWLALIACASLFIYPAMHMLLWGDISFLWHVTVATHTYTAVVESIVTLGFAIAKKEHVTLVSNQINDDDDPRVALLSAQNLERFLKLTLPIVYHQNLWQEHHSSPFHPLRLYFSLGPAVVPTEHKSKVNFRSSRSSFSARPRLQ